MQCYIAQNQQVFCHIHLLLLLLFLYINSIVIPQPTAAIFTTGDERYLGSFISQRQLKTYKVFSRDHTAQSKEATVAAQPNSDCWSDLDKRVEPN